MVKKILRILKMKKINLKNEKKKKNYKKEDILLYEEINKK